MAKDAGKTTNPNELFNDEIYKALKKLGYIFPSSIEDFEILENEVKTGQTEKPVKLLDPFLFLNQDEQLTPKVKFTSPSNSHTSNLAQAAREGQEIPDHIKKKMKDDKSKNNK